MFCITLHNIEEALWLTEWQIKNMPNIRKNPKKENFIFAVLGITILGYLTAGLFMLYPDKIYFQYAFIGFIGAMLINAIIPHLLLTIIYRKYCPGVFTGCFLLMPFHIIFLINATNNGLGIIEIIIATLIVGLILLISIPLFQILANKIFNNFIK